MKRSIVLSATALLLGAAAIALSACVYEPMAPGYVDPGYSYYYPGVYAAPGTLYGPPVYGSIFIGGGGGGHWHGGHGWR